MITLLAIEQGRDIQQLLRSQASPEGLTIDTVRTMAETLDRCRHTAYDVVIWDTRTVTAQAGDGLAQLESLGARCPDTQVIVVAHRDHVDLALDCLKTGAYYTLHRPLDGEVLWALLDVAIQRRRRGELSRSLPASSHPQSRFDALLGSSAPMQTVYKRIEQAAATDVTVLITGETGTGKDLVATAIHQHSQRKDKPYVAVHTGAMVSDLLASELFGYDKGAFTGAAAAKPGQFEQAHKGTLFLDEIGTMDMKAQIFLLRLLETQTLRRLGGTRTITVDVRLIAATNEQLEEAIARGVFRNDLFYRLDIFRIDLPPLHTRAGDIPLLAREFLAHFAALHRKPVQELAPETVQVLEQYVWPGNVRELRNVIQRAVLLAPGRLLTVDLLPDRLCKAPEPPTAGPSEVIEAGMTLREAERVLLTRALAATGGNKQAVAQRLGISRRALYNKLERYGLR
ncbi:MAG: sigma 54-interacting transcriptional regulator [Candidatus Tectimicrobiota bacterium]